MCGIIRLIEKVYERLLTTAVKRYLYCKRFRECNHRAMANAFTDFQRSLLKSCGQNLQLFPPVQILNPENVSIGDNVALGAYVYIWGGGEVNIGDNVMIATHTVITSFGHDYTKELMNKTITKGRISIEDGVWIGANSVILPGVRLGKGSVIGAGSVVTHDVQANTVVVGVPAKYLKNRNCIL